MNIAFNLRENSHFLVANLPARDFLKLLPEAKERARENDRQMARAEQTNLRLMGTGFLYC